MSEPDSPPHKRRRKDRPPEMTADMCRTDLIEVLSTLGFRGKAGVSLVALDKPVRDYLIRALQQR